MFRIYNPDDPTPGEFLKGGKKRKSRKSRRRKSRKSRKSRRRKY